METSQAILEVVLAHAIATSQRARTEAAVSGDKFPAGMAFAYYDIADVIYEQAELLGIQWADRTLADFDPVTLLAQPPPKGL